MATQKLVAEHAQTQAPVCTLYACLLEYMDSVSIFRKAKYFSYFPEVKMLCKTSSDLYKLQMETEFQVMGTEITNFVAK